MRPVWQDSAVGAAFMRNLLRPAAAQEPITGVDPASAAAWCITQGIGPLAHAAYRETWPALTDALAFDAMTATGEFALYGTALARMIDGLDTRVVLLKGAALALTAYPAPDQRTLSDIDVWLAPSAIDACLPRMVDLGFVPQEHSVGIDGAPVLSRRGKIKFNEPGWRVGGLELHRNPFAGELLERTAAVALDEIWRRVEPGTWGERQVWRMSAEDMFLHVAVHLAVGNQFSLAAVRGLLDLAFIVRRAAHDGTPLDWDAIVDRARRWRVQAPVWLVLVQLVALLDINAAIPARDAMQPGRWRRRMLEKWVNPAAILAGSSLRSPQRRLPYLLLMVDSPLNRIQ